MTEETETYHPDELETDTRPVVFGENIHTDDLLTHLMDTDPTLKDTIEKMHKRIRTEQLKRLQEPDPMDQYFCFKKLYLEEEPDAYADDADKHYACEQYRSMSDADVAIFDRYTCTHLPQLDFTNPDTTSCVDKNVYKFMHEVKYKRHYEYGETYGLAVAYMCKRCFYQRFKVWHHYHDEKPTLRRHGGEFIFMDLRKDEFKDLVENIHETPDFIENVLPKIYECDFYSEQTYTFDGKTY